MLAPDGQGVDAITYEVVTKSTKPLLPSSEYLGLLIAGARKWSLPLPYQVALAAIQPA